MRKIPILKIKLKRAGSEVVSATNQLKLIPLDGKKRKIGYTLARICTQKQLFGYMRFLIHTYIVHTHSPIC